MKSTVYRLFLALFVSTALSSPLTAGEDAGPARADDALLEDLYYSSGSVELTAKEKAAIAIAEAWQQGEALTMNPVAGPDGSIEFLFGAERPSIVCAVMQITDIELQAGEAVTGVNLGDSVRWQVQPAVSGGDVTHILVRPRQVGLDTSMVVTTDRRTYHIRLRSHRVEYLPRVRFSYMEDALAKWDAVKAKAAEKREAATIPETNEYLGDLDFNYQVAGKAAWKPVRVYNDGVKTILEMPARMRRTEAPTLLVVRKEGRVLKKAETVLVNYRVQRGRYIVDAVFDQAVMVVGVGGNQERVTITRTPQARRGA
ncbi:MAG: P-type conjugative transfer protein TrbG [Planctomycetota bacterium]|nr:P-type conjugative transfer protein TrbG [Planctomycetota bacterium]